LRDEVTSGRFREDLYYRLNVFPLHLLPLRERTDDIFPLAQQLVSRHCLQSERVLPKFSACAEKALLSHQWHGNVRELDNVLQRALILQPGQTITANDLAFESMSSLMGAEQNIDTGKSESQLSDDLRSHEQRHILDALAKNNCSRRATASELGISERTLRYKLSRFREEGVAIPEKVGKKSA